jgi:hypothetical protein
MIFHRKFIVEIHGATFLICMRLTAKHTKRSRLMRACILIAFFLCIPLLGMSRTGTTVKTEVKREFYSNGQVKRIVKTRIRRTKHFELYNFYKRTAITITEFNENGTIKSRDKIITKVGDTGRPCFEVVTLKIEYNSNGTRKTYDKWICDKHKGIYKEYDENGKLVFTRISKKRKN